jgi:hypothetical protein
MTTSPAREEIQELLDNGYTPSALPQLEAYLQLQVKLQVPYHGDAIRSLVKHYLLFPTACNNNHVAEALLLAAMEFPNHADYIALRYMLPHPASAAGGSSASANSNSKLALDLASSATPVIATIKECFAHLEACQFEKFWASYAILEKLDPNNSSSITAMTTPAISELAQKSVARMQHAVLHALSFTYQQAPVSVVLAAINAKDASSIQALVDMRKDSVVEKVDATTVTFIPNVYNTKKQRVYQESLSFAAVTNLMNKINSH